MKKVEKPKKPILFYYVIALVVLILLNTFLFPNLLNKHKVKAVDYGTFLTMVEEKNVSKVELDGDTITFTDKEEDPNYYETTTFDDPDLVNRLEDAGCEFGRVAQEEMNPLFSFFLVWILPILIFWALGQFLTKHTQISVLSARKVHCLWDLREPVNHCLQKKSQGKRMFRFSLFPVQNS